MKSVKSALLVSAVALVSMPTVAFAADDQQSATTGGQAKSQTPAEQSGDIVVTAQRRAGTLQTTPITMNVLDGDDLAQRGVGSLNEALNGVPGVYLQENNKGLNVEVRGVGTTLDSAAGDPGVNVNLDGVYLRQASTIPSGLFDVERIEVLKGPQGTLYGRNATGGVVNVLTKNPELDSFDYQGSLTAGNYDLLRTEAAVNVPAGKTLALRAAFGSETHKGYLDSGQDDADRVAGRLKLLWKPVETVSILAGVSYSHDGGFGPGSVLANEPEGSRHAANPYPNTPAGAAPGDLNQKFFTAFGNVEWDAGAVKVTFIPTYSDYDYKYQGSTFGFYSLQQQREKQTTTELRISSPDGSRLIWTAGGYYFHSNLAAHAQIPGQVNDYQPDIETNSYAAFGDVTLPVTDKFRVFGGIRYTEDHRSQTGSSFGVAPGPVFAVNNKLTSNAVNFRAGLQYDVAPGSMFYASFATGYKAGGFLADMPGAIPGNSSYDATYKPEHLDAVEAGIKSRLFDNKLVLNLSGFYYNYDNYQVSTIGFAPNTGGLTAMIYNAQGKTKIYGAEVQAVFRPTSADQLELTLAPLKGHYGAFIVAGFPFPTDLSGKRIPHAPELSGSAAYQHVFQLSSGGNVTARAETYFSTRYLAEPMHTAANSWRKGYTRTDLNLTYSSDDDRWSLGAWVRNLENSWIVSVKVNTPGVGEYGLQAPRTFGATLTVHG